MMAPSDDMRVASQGARADPALGIDGRDRGGPDADRVDAALVPLDVRRGESKNSAFLPL